MADMARLENLYTVLGNNGSELTLDIKSVMAISYENSKLTIRFKGNSFSTLNISRAAYDELKEFWQDISLGGA